ncbi:LPS-assembly protein LptD [Burkholderiales bacterium GJ-E10]|nr:LPS-assembly protein LptD [Burkholderiales bacterium GJ-E10]
MRQGNRDPGHRVAAALVVAGLLLTVASGWADPGPAVALRLERTLGAGRGAVVVGQAPPIYARADHVVGAIDESTTLTGSVELRRAGMVLFGDRVVYDIATDEVNAQGHVRLVAKNAVFNAPSLKFQVEAQTGTMPDASYTYPARHGSGKSNLIEFLGEGNERMHDATFTTCNPDNPSWWVKADTLDINQGDQEATAYAATLYFGGVPLIDSPYFDFPIGDARKSGFLTPGYMQNSLLGSEFVIPYYWNIAPNYDYTFTPYILPSRGTLLGNEFRFLTPETQGIVNYDVMPHDRGTNTMRDHMVLSTQYVGPAGLSAGINYNRVSDPNFLIDFSQNILASSPQELPQEAYLNYAKTYWTTTLRVQESQTLVPLLLPYDPGPYQRVPDLTVQGQHLDWNGFDVTGFFDATHFTHPAINPYFVVPATNPKYDAPETFNPGFYTQSGSRFILNPEVSYPILSPGWFIIPKVQWNATYYQLDPIYNYGNTSTTRTVPTASFDTGLIFDRPIHWLGADARQTLEPRMYYAFVPYRNQSLLPNFDSTVSDLTFAQLFAPNIFTGYDRVAQANELTTALTSRVIDSASGAERLRVGIGQRFYFSPQMVTLPGVPPTTSATSDTLFLADASMGRKWSVNMSVDYSTVTSQTALASFGLHWQPRETSVVNFTYQYETPYYTGYPINNYGLSTQWPLSKNWYGVGALNYSVANHSWVESLAGVEYRADCWVGRVIFSRYAIPYPVGTGQFNNFYTTTYFFQIQLNGLASVGTNPAGLLQSNILGYQSISPPRPPPGPFDFYQ